MNPKNITLAKNPDLAASWAAIQRAAKRAAEVAASTNTELVVVRNGQCVHIKPTPSSR
ncbi:MAG: hypothetical protein PHU06_06735 [Gallionella sp.]|nr:hypothetical protein [Gallionella sp.]MDD4958044.1 hypothetical protein [Gallionella sp.]